MKYRIRGKDIEEEGGLDFWCCDFAGLDFSTNETKAHIFDNWNHACEILTTELREMQKDKREEARNWQELTVEILQ